MLTAARLGSRSPPLPAFRPVNDDHSVTSVAFQLKLDEFVEPPTLQAAAAADAPWRTTLPAVQQLPPVVAQIAGQGMEFPAIQFAVVRPDARPIWALRFAGFELAVECHSYTRWAHVWAQARTLLDQAYTLVRTFQSDANILELRLEVVDRFLSEGPTYNAADLFKGGGLIGDRLLKQPGAWHTHTGWFETEDGVRILHNVKVNVRGHAAGGKPGERPYSFTVTHSQQAVLDPSAAIAWERAPSVLEKLHAGNKAQLLDLLAPDMLTRIGLNS